MQARISVGNLLNKVLLDHPHALGESYWQHQRRAVHFGFSMVLAGAACLVHAVIPALFVRTASGKVQSLYAQMHVTRRLGGASIRRDGAPSSGYGSARITSTAGRAAQY